MAVLYNAAIAYDAPHAPCDITSEVKHVQFIIIRGGIEYTGTPEEFFIDAYYKRDWRRMSSGMNNLLNFWENSLCCTSVNGFKPIL